MLNPSLFCLFGKMGDDRGDYLWYSIVKPTHKADDALLGAAGNGMGYPSSFGQGGDSLADRRFSDKGKTREAQKGLVFEKNSTNPFFK